MLNGNECQEMGIDGQCLYGHLTFVTKDEFLHKICFSLFSKVYLNVAWFILFDELCFNLCKLPFGELGSKINK